MEMDEKLLCFNCFRSHFIKDVIIFARCHTEMFKSGSIFTLFHTEMAKSACAKHVSERKRVLQIHI